jgi:iron(III) transport system substrate-binding protein
MMNRLICLGGLFVGVVCLALMGAGGCSKESEPSKESGAAETQPAAAAVRGEVVLYTSADEPFARQVIEAFTQKTNIRVQPLFDSEANKTTGMARRIRAEAASPRADVFWASEPFQTIQMAQEGLTEVYLPETARNIPIAYRDAKDRWIGFGLRGRVLGYDPRQIDAADLPRTWAVMAEPPFAGKVIWANPLFGTTRGHLAAMLVLWGEPAYTKWVEQLAAAGVANRLAAGNAQIARQTGMGRIVLGATDTDDVIVQQESGAKIEMTYPDMGGGGTLLLPNTVAIMKGAPHPEFAKELTAFLCSAEVEELLARSASRNIPVRPALRDKLKIEMPPNTPVDYVKIAEAMPRAIEIVQERWK